MRGVQRMKEPSIPSLCERSEAQIKAIIDEVYSQPKPARLMLESKNMASASRAVGSIVQQLDDLSDQAWGFVNEMTWPSDTMRTRLLTLAEELATGASAAAHESTETGEA